MKNKGRDYAREYRTRQKREQRLNADIERDKVDAFKRLLKQRGQTFVKWLNDKIDKELEED